MKEKRPRLTGTDRERTLLAEVVGRDRSGDERGENRELDPKHGGEEWFLFHDDDGVIYAH